MPIKSTLSLSLTLILLSVLSACGHIKTQQKNNNNPSISVEPKTESKTESKAESKAESNIQIKSMPNTNDVSINNENIGYEEDSETSLENPDAFSNSQAATFEPTYTNVFNRIQAGFSFPDLQSKHVEYYEQWNSKHPTYLANLFERAEPFLFYIVEEIEKRNLPMEIALLPAIESAFKTDAISHSGAAGLWQFIPSTGRHFKLRQDWWYDGRRDLISSTNAALDYLTKLNKDFNGDWFLALAAYNAGGGTIRKAIRYNKRLGRGTRFEDLPLRSETARYVPKMIALKNIIEQPDLYNVELPNIANESYFEQIAIPRQLDLNRFAENAQISSQELSNLNAGFLRWATSPLGPNRLLVPVQKYQIAKTVVTSIEKTPFIKFKHHDIANGETLSNIANRYNVSVNALKLTNKLSNSNIRAGRSLMIPLHAESASQTNFSDASNIISSKNNKVVHRVKRGDTLWSIARNYQVKVKQLLDWNQLPKRHILSLNQAVLIYLH